MTINSGDLSRRREEVRDMRPAMSPIIQFSLDQIKRHFDENMAAIASLGDVAETIASEKPHVLDAIFFVRFSRHGLCPLFSSAREVARPPVVTGA